MHLFLAKIPDSSCCFDDGSNSSVLCFLTLALYSCVGSGSSGKPPNSDELKKPRTRSLRKWSGHKPGGQKGIRNKRSMVSDPEHVQSHPVTIWPQCATNLGLLILIGMKSGEKIANSDYNQIMPDCKDDEPVTTSSTIYNTNERSSWWKNTIK